MFTRLYNYVIGRKATVEGVAVKHQGKTVPLVAISIRNTRFGNTSQMLCDFHTFLRTAKQICDADSSKELKLVPPEIGPRRNDIFPTPQGAKELTTIIIPAWAMPKMQFQCAMFGAMLLKVCAEKKDSYPELVDFILHGKTSDTEEVKPTVH